VQHLVDRLAQRPRAAGFVQQILEPQFPHFRGREDAAVTGGQNDRETGLDLQQLPAELKDVDAELGLNNSSSNG